MHHSHPMARNDVCGMAERLDQFDAKLDLTIAVFI